ncbi:hypothetical protein LTR85_007434 [Meristemomyces frigidus]|nr:hypothetical protein LTR85_007434 [Meristemomyces frigidus]
MALFAPNNITEPGHGPTNVFGLCAPIATRAAAGASSACTILLGLALLVSWAGGKGWLRCLGGAEKKVVVGWMVVGGVLGLVGLGLDGFFTWRALHRGKHPLVEAVVVDTVLVRVSKLVGSVCLLVDVAIEALTPAPAPADTTTAPAPASPPPSPVLGSSLSGDPSLSGVSLPGFFPSDSGLDLASASGRSTLRSSRLASSSVELDELEAGTASSTSGSVRRR